MAKYVGKIFRVGNNKLGIRGNEAHDVYVKWFNPFNNKFKCRVITSLEDEFSKTSINNSMLENKYSSYNKETEKHCVLNSGKYKKLRRGNIEPIPIIKTENFNTWSGFSKSIYLKKSDLKDLSRRK